MPSTIRKGSRGSDVILCQDCLTQHGFPCDADGIFGSGTEAKVKAFQSDNGLTADGIVGSGTWGKLLANPDTDWGQVVTLPPNPLPPLIVQARKLGHTIWGDKWRLWLFGVRSPNRDANAFDDMLGCAFINDDDQWEVLFWPGTTDPGTFWLENPSNPKGTAILKAGQYLDTWKIDLHAGKYEALCQRAGEVTVYRDSSGDDKLDLDPGSTTTGYFGINLHAATQRPDGVSTQVDKWSAGCQVHASANGFAKMMELAHKQVEKTGRETFSYTLMDQWF